jgi:hypothetical protein
MIRLAIQGRRRSRRGVAVDGDIGPSPFSHNSLSRKSGGKETE